MGFVYQLLCMLATATRVSPQRKKTKSEFRTRISRSQHLWGTIRSSFWTLRGLAETKRAFDSLWETVRRPFSARRTHLLRLWTHLANRSFRLDWQPRIFGPARAA